MVLFSRLTICLYQWERNLNDLNGQRQCDHLGSSKQIQTYIYLNLISLVLL